MTNTNEVRIEVSTHCNFLCKFCPHSIKFKRNQEVMSNSLFEKLLTKVKVEAPLINSLTLSGFREAFLDKDLINKIECAKDMNYDIHILTNGSLLSKGKIKNLIELGIKSLRFSVHAVDNNSY